MIIDDFDVLGRARSPTETDSPLIVDSDTMLALSVAGQSLDAVPGDRRKVFQLIGVIDHS
jgi:hypothetical protein